MTSLPVLDLVVGARPNYVKAAALVHAYRDLAVSEPMPFRFRIVATGQHRDAAMSSDLAAQLEFPQADVHLRASGTTPSELTASILQTYDALLRRERPAAVLVIGDVLSTFAAALAAKQNGLPLVHVEAGLRSGDRSMPEELNRIATDHFSDLLFTTTLGASANLRAEGIADDRIQFTGNTVIDTLLRNRHRWQMPSFFAENDLTQGGYYLLTLHRPSNVDNADALKRILSALADGVPDEPIVFPAHPRTVKQLPKNVLPPNLLLLPPQLYLQFTCLLGHCRAVLTDSGGVSEEATVLDKPCLVFRQNTERPETVVDGTTELVTSLDQLPVLLQRIRSGHWKKGSIPAYWDGAAALRTVRHLHAWTPLL